MMMRGENEDHEELTVKQEFDDTSWTEPILKSGINKRTIISSIMWIFENTALFYYTLNYNLYTGVAKMPQNGCDRDRPHE